MNASDCKGTMQLYLNEPANYTVAMDALGLKYRESSVNPRAFMTKHP